MDPVLQARARLGNAVRSSGYGSKDVEDRRLALAAAHVERAINRALEAGITPKQRKALIALLRP